MAPPAASEERPTAEGGLLKPTALGLAAAGFLLAASLGTAAGIVEALPAELARKGDSGSVATEAVISGTALSPPLTTLAALTVFAYLALCREPWARKPGAAGIVALSAYYAIGGLAKAHAAGDVPGLAASAVTWLGFGLALLMLSLGFRELGGNRMVGLTVKTSRDAIRTLTFR